jgi:hypothetical protein
VLPLSVSVSRTSVLPLGLVDSSAPSLWRLDGLASVSRRAQSSLSQSPELRRPLGLTGAGIWQTLRRFMDDLAVCVGSVSCLAGKRLPWEQIEWLTEMSSCLGTIGCSVGAVQPGNRSAQSVSSTFSPGPGNAINHCPLHFRVPCSSVTLSCSPSAFALGSNRFHCSI